MWAVTPKRFKKFRAYFNFDKKDFSVPDRDNKDIKLANTLENSPDYDVFRRKD